VNSGLRRQIRNQLWIILLVLFFSFLVLRFELSLLGRHSTTWAIPPAFFHSGYFWYSILLFIWAGPCSNIPIHAFCSSWDERYMQPHPAFSVEIGSCKLFFCWGWPETTVLSISASCVAGMTVSQHKAIGWDEGLINCLPGLALNCDPPDLHLSSS
jgi:hypothetical protein